MKQINPFNINWNRILISVLLIAVLILSSIVCSNCNNETKAFDDYEKKTNHLKQENQASENIIALLKVANEELKQENDSISKIKNKVIQEKIKEFIDPIKNYSLKDQQSYFTSNYKSLMQSYRFVKLDSLQALNVITDIEKGKIALYEVGEQNKIIFNNNKTIGNYEVQVEEFEKIGLNSKLILSECETSLKESQKQVKFRFLIGGGFGVSKEFNQSLYKLNLGIQNIKGNIYNISYLKINNNDFIVAEYYLSLFKIKE